MICGWGVKAGIMACLQVKLCVAIYECFRKLVFMVALWNRADHYIFALWFLSIFLFFFPRLISAAADWMSTILHHCSDAVYWREGELKRETFRKYSARTNLCKH